MLQAVAKWWCLPVEQRRILVLSLVALPIMGLFLRAFGFVRSLRVVEWASARTARRDATRGDGLRAIRLARMVEVAGRRGAIRARCLPQALLVHLLLRRRGLSPVLRLGAGREPGRFEAHAWVELDGVALDDAAQSHVPFSRRDGLAAATR